MANWKYTPGRLILSAFLVLVILRAIKLLLEVHAKTGTMETNVVSTVSTSREAAKAICKYSEDELASLVWSHRAHYSDQEVDGSQQAVEQLLKFGIRNFDVDVSCNVLPSSDTCEFVIAHPSVFADKEKLEHRKHIQTVSAFLNQIHTFVQANKPDTTKTTANVLMPVITLEMKFTKVSHQIEFAKLVQMSPLAAHVAIIGSDPSILKNILPYMTQSGVAAAYRTKPLSNHDYTWPEPTHNEYQTLASGGLFFGEHTKSQSFTPVPPPLVVVAPSHASSSSAFTTGSAPNEKANSTTVVTSSLIPAQVISLLPNSQTLYVRSPQLANRKYLQVYMPDVKLVKYPLVWQKVSEPAKTDLTSGKGKSLRTGNSGDSSSSSSSTETARDVTTSNTEETTTISVKDGTSAHDPNRLVVAWVVDTNTELSDAIAKGVNGVISNRPVALLAELRGLHAQSCRSSNTKLQ